MPIKTFADSNAVAAAFAAEFQNLIQNELSGQTKVTVALSGGSTPKILFKLWAEQYGSSVDWERVHLFWGDERMVPPEDPESNFGVANSLCLESLGVPAANIHRVLGESDPEVERVRYEAEILEFVPVDAEGRPQFDLIILGMGDDGHTASIFPHQMELMNSKRVCEIATHPSSGQKRITFSGPVLNNANRVAFLITGDNKAKVLEQIVKKTGDFESFPTSHINAKQVDFFIDEAAGSLLSD